MPSPWLRGTLNNALDAEKRQRRPLDRGVHCTAEPTIGQQFGCVERRIGGS